LRSPVLRLLVFVTGGPGCSILIGPGRALVGSPRSLKDGMSDQATEVVPGLKEALFKFILDAFVQLRLVVDAYVWGCD